MTLPPPLRAVMLCLVVISACASVADTGDRAVAPSTVTASAPTTDDPGQRASTPASPRPTDAAADVSDLSAADPVSTAPAVPSTANPAPTVSATDRLDALQTQVSAWANATDLAQAQEAAEGARNLVVGPDGPYYGDATEDGRGSGQSDQGLLPGLDGQVGIASEAADNQCVVDDVLGGSWADPRERWAILDTAIAEWSPTSNPFPTLPSHPQRVVGWATLTLQTDDLAQAIEFAGHAQLHVDVSRQAYDCG